VHLNHVKTSRRLQDRFKDPRLERWDDVLEASCAMAARRLWAATTGGLHGELGEAL
jgi:hypothetical protein